MVERHHASDPLARLRDRTPVLETLAADGRKTRPLGGTTVAVSSHLEPKTGIFVETVRDAGATVLCTANDPDSVHRNIKADATGSSGNLRFPCFNIVRHMVAFFGEFRPSAEEDFPETGVNSSDFADAPIGGLREPLDLAPGWHEYRFEWTTPRMDQEETYFAVGNSVVWESDRTHYVDDITLRLTPAKE